MSCLSGKYRVSRRSANEILKTIFDVHVSLGIIVQLEAQKTMALTVSYNKILADVRADDARNVDETCWSKRGKRRWLWGAACEQVAAFRIHVSRGFAGLQSLLGEKIHRSVTSDRWGLTIS